MEFLPEASMVCKDSVLCGLVNSVITVSHLAFWVCGSFLEYLFTLCRTTIVGCERNVIKKRISFVLSGLEQLRFRALVSRKLAVDPN